MKVKPKQPDKDITSNRTPKLGKRVDEKDENIDLQSKKLNPNLNGTTQRGVRGKNHSSQEGQQSKCPTDVGTTRISSAPRNEKGKDEVTEEEKEPKDDDCNCGVCGLSEEEHKGKDRGKFEWIGCDCCGRWYAGSCLIKQNSTLRIKNTTSADCVFKIRRR